MTNIAWKTESGVSLGGFAYGYDALGRVVSRDHELGGESFGRAYSYDDRDRLASDGDVAYIYDAAGNRMARTEDGTTTTYALGVGDRLASWTGGAYSYDAAGNVTRIVRDGRPTLDLAWNGRYQLVSVSTNGVFAEGYAYDALGRRVSTTTADGTTRHVYDDSWQVIADIDEQGNVVASYAWGAGIDRLLAVRVGGANYYPLTDIQGTVWGYVDSANNVVARWQYDAWGNVVGEEVSVAALATLRYRFQGREWSAATGLVNFRNRWYDAETGRWISKDPIGLNGGINLYEFCDDSGPNAIDPFGYARIRTRPLDVWGSRPFSRINLPGNLDPRHREIFFEDGEDKKHPESVGYGPEGVHRDAAGIPYNNTEYRHYDDKLMRAAVETVVKTGKWTPEKYNFFTHNCQDFVDAVIEEYNKLENNGWGRKAVNWSQQLW